MNVNKIKDDFPFFINNSNTHFLDSAASSLKLGKGIKSLTNYLKNNGTNVHRGVYRLAHEATNLYEKSRDKVAEFLNASSKEIIFTKGTTNSLNILALSLEGYINEGDEILISNLEHHSNFLPWLNLAKKRKANLKFIPLENGMITLDNFKKSLTNKTKLVITHHISNVLGYLTPIKEMIKLSKEKDALVVLDAAQSINKIKIDVKDLDIDFLTFSAHKMYGPNGVGILYGKAKLLKELKPVEFGGEMVDEVKLNNPSFKDIPYKFEAGTPPIGEAIALGSVIDYLNQFDLNDLYQKEITLRNYLIDNLKDEKDLIIYNKDNITSLFTFNIKDVHPHDTASFLDHYNVLVRAGHHCNQLTMKYLGVNSTVRASFGIYNTLDDVKALILAIKETIKFFKEGI
ncbi:MAG: aminotransferase class V-fold PLP-dependent enzyme [Acholeplasmataceae bacterium]